MQKYIEFKKLFKGDSKLNITALDNQENVLAHRAVAFESVLSTDALNKILKGLKNEVGENAYLIEKYEVIYPSVK